MSSFKDFDMTELQSAFLLILLATSLAIFIKSMHESMNKKNAFGLTPFLLPLGIFVWGDGVVFGLFWLLASGISLIIKDWLFFLLIVSVFWLVRSIGETIYWLNQQFSTLERNPVQNLPWNSIFHNDSVWFVHQIIWQCITVISLVASLYLGFVWLKTI